MKLIYFRVRVFFPPHLILSDFLFGRIFFLFRFGTKLKSTNFLFKPTAKFNGNQDTSCNMSYSLLAINQWQRKRARTQVAIWLHQDVFRSLLLNYIWPVSSEYLH